MKRDLCHFFVFGDAAARSLSFVLVHVDDNPDTNGGPQTQIGVGSHWGLFHEPRNLAMPTGKPLAC